MIKNLLTHSAFWTINKEMARILGIEEALLLTDIIDKYYYFRDLGQLQDHDGELYFYCTGESFEKDIGMSYKVQQRCANKLRKLELIATHLAGVPAKTYYRIEHNKILQMVQASSSQRDKLVQPSGNSQFPPKGKTLYKNKEQELSNKNKEQEADTPDLPADDPALLAVNDLIQFLNFELGRKFRRADKQSIKQMRARLKEGFTIEEIKAAAKNAHADSYHKSTKFEHLTPEFFTRGDKINKFVDREPPLIIQGNMFTHLRDITEELINENNDSKQHFTGNTGT